MRPETQDRVDAFWSRYFALDRERLHEPGVTVTPSDDGWPGIVVAGDSRAAHVRCPDELERLLLASLDDNGPSVWRPETWQALLGVRIAAVLGPSVHAYADETEPLPPPDSRVREVSSTALKGLAALVPRDEWAESGFAGQVVRVFALVEDERVLAAANLTDFDGMPADVGVVTAPAERGRRLGVAVATAATRCAIQENGIARWRALETNRASRAIAQRLGFADYGSNLAVRLATDG